jgi:hypothetical protein
MIKQAIKRRATGKFLYIALHIIPYKQKIKMKQAIIRLG